MKTQLLRLSLDKLNISSHHRLLPSQRQVIHIAQCHIRSELHQNRLQRQAKEKRTQGVALLWPHLRQQREISKYYFYYYYYCYYYYYYYYYLFIYLFKNQIT